MRRKKEHIRMKAREKKKKPDPAILHIKHHEKTRCRMKKKIEVTIKNIVLDINKKMLVYVFVFKYV